MGAIASIVQALKEEDDLLVLIKMEGKADFDAKVISKTDARAHERWAEGLVQHTKAKSTKTGTYKKYRYVRQVT